MSKTNSYEGCARFNFLAVYDGKLYAQGYQYDYSEQYQAPCNSLLQYGDVCNFNTIDQVHILDNGTGGNGQWSISNNPIVKHVEQQPYGHEFKTACYSPNAT